MHWTTDTIYGPFVTTKWKQSEPFNWYCPQINGQYCLAGCVPITTGQIAAYHEHPSSYNGKNFNWTSIKADSIPIWTPDILSVAGLIADLGRIVNINYGLIASTVQRDNIVNSLDSLDYHHSSLMYYNYQTCVQELELDRPVYMIGEAQITQDSLIGHSWIIDGCLIRSVHIYQYPNTTEFWRYPIQRLAHCNWSLQGDYDGYYRSDAFDLSSPVNVTRTLFDINLVMFTEIYPNDQ